MHSHVRYNAVNAAASEYEAIFNRDTERLADLMDKYALANQRGDRGRANSLEYQIAVMMSESTALGYLLGKRRTLLEYDHYKSKRAASYASFIDPIGEVPSKPLTIPKVKFKEAVTDMLSRDPRLVGSAEEVQKLYSVQRGFAMVRSMSQAITNKVHSVIAKGLEEGIEYGTAINLIAKIGDFDKAYAANVYRTNIAHAYTAGRFKQAADEDVADVVGAMGYVAILDSDVRKNHAAAHGFIARADDPVWAAMAPPAGYQCFLPDNALAGKFTGASKAFYSGKAIVLQTAMGNRISITINHPVLTRSGWKRAGEVGKGDDLVCYNGDVDLFRAFNDRMPSGINPTTREVDDKDMPAIPKNIFDTLAVSGVSSISSDGRPLDFHGEAARFNGNIDICGSYRTLPDGLGTNRFQFTDDLGLIFSGPRSSPVHRIGASNPLFLGSDPTFASFPSGGTLALYDAPIVRAGLSERPFQALCIGLASKSNVVFKQDSGDDLTADTKIIGQLFDAHPGLIAFDKVVRVAQFDFRGHVYDFQTENGWIVAKNIVTSNCRCRTRIVSQFELERSGLVERGGQLPNQSLPEGAHRDKGFVGGHPLVS